MFFKKKKSRDPAGVRKPKSGSATHNIEQFVVEEIELQGDARPAPMSTGRQFKPRKTSRVWPLLRRQIGLIGLAALLAAATLFSRSLWPLDETRLVSMAWEMSLRGDWWVPLLNGEPATRTAPLPLWLIGLGWAVSGVNDWWPRVLPVLFALAGAYVAGGLARRLWPGQAEIARYAPFVLIGSFLWAVYATYAVSDMLLAFFTLLAMYALVWIWRQRDYRVWLLLGLALGMGMLVRGAWIFLYVYPLALLAPLWARAAPRPRWGHWYADLLKAAVLAALIFAAWAIPAAMRAGLPYGLNALFPPFSAYVYEFVSPQQPLWWYLALLPIAGLPWTVWPLIWIRLWRTRRDPVNAGIVFCLVWSALSLAIFSSIDIKQAHFLLPLVPAFVLPVAYLVFDQRFAEDQDDSVFTTLVFPIIVLGGLLAVLPGLPRVEFLPDFLWDLSPFIGIAIVLVGMAVGGLPIHEVKPRALNMAAALIALISITWLIIGWQFNGHYQVDGIARELSKAQSEHRPLAYIGDYAGQYQFAGRLHRPLTVLKPDAIEIWLRENPTGWVVADTWVWQPASLPGAQPLLEQAHRGGATRIWDATVLPAPHIEMSTDSSSAPSTP